MERAEDLLESQPDEFALGAVLLSARHQHMLPGLLEKVAPIDFADAHLGEMWNAAKALLAGEERVTKRTLLKRLPDNPAVAHRISQLAGEPVDEIEVTRAAVQVISMARSRRLIQAVKRIAQHTPVADSYDDAFQFASDQLSALALPSGAGTARSFADALRRWQEWMDAPQDTTRVIPTPWPDLDDILAGGLHPKRSYIIGGRPGDGKSIALLNFAGHAARLGHRAVVFSVEMGETEVVSRLMASGARAEYGQITRRNVNDHNRMLLERFAADYGDMPLMLDDKTDITVEYVASRCRTLKRSGGVDLVVVDYLQLLRESEPGSRASRERAVAHISRSLKLLADELDCAVIVACQLNRNAANADRPPAASELRESGSIEQDADVVMLLHHPKLNNQPTGEIEVLVEKNRTGRKGSVTLEWRAYQARIS